MVETNNAKSIDIVDVKGICATKCQHSEAKQGCLERCECQEVCSKAKESDRCERRCLQNKKMDIKYDDGTGTGGQRIDAKAYEQKLVCWNCLNRCVQSSPTPTEAYNCQSTQCGPQCEREQISWNTSSSCRASCLSNRQNYIDCLTQCGN
jgi:hypothetical protein